MVRKKTSKKAVVQPKKRDWFDHTSMILSVVAIAVSVALPLWIRSTDRREMVPDISIELSFMHRIVPESEPVLLSQVVDSWNISKWTYPPSERTKNDYLKWFCEHFLFRVQFANKRNYPCSLSHFHFNKLVVEYPNSDRSNMGGHITQLKDGSDVPEQTPFVNLGPHETKYVTIVSSRILLPSTQNMKGLETSSQKLQPLGASPINPEDGITIVQSSTNSIFINKKIFDGEYLAKGTIISCQIEAFADTGQKFTSNEITKDTTFHW